MRFLIVLLLALAAAVGLWIMYTHPTEARVADEGLAAPDRAATVRDERPAELEPAPDPIVDEPNVAPRARPAERETIEAAPPPTPEESSSPEAAFATKYADHSPQDLNRASRSLYSEHRSVVNALMQERYDNAFYTAYPYEYDAQGERLDASKVVPAPPPGEHRIRQVFEDPGVAEWRVVELPPEQHPELYLQYAEYRWVSNEAKRRTRDG